MTNDGRPSYGYVLVSSRSPEDFGYYGVSVDPENRLKQHLSSAKTLEKTGKCDNTWKGRWILREMSSGYEIYYRVLFQYDSEHAAYADEDRRIREIRGVGHRLRNLTDGGKGFLVSDKTREYMREAQSRRMRAWFADPENKKEFLERQKRGQDENWRKNVSASLKRKRSSKAERNRMSQRAKDLWKNEEWAENQRRVRSSEEFSAKQSEILSAICNTEEWKGAQSERSKAAWESRRRKGNTEPWNKGKRDPKAKTNQPKTPLTPEERSQRIKDGSKAFHEDTERKKKSYADRGKKVSESKKKEWAQRTPEEREIIGVRMLLGKRLAAARRNGWVLDVVQPHGQKESA